jgi:hypothetical protein
MMVYRYFTSIMILLFCFTPEIIAQDNEETTCPTIVQEAVAYVADLCTVRGEIMHVMGT